MIHRSLPYWYFGWFIAMGLITAISLPASPLYFLTADDLAQVELQGMQNMEPGTYVVWAWSKDQLPITALIGGQSVEASAIPDAPADQYSWKPLGHFTAGQEGTFYLNVLTNLQGRYLEKESVGYLALAASPEWKPEPFFEKTKIFPHTTESVHDAREKVLRTNEQYYSFPEFRTKREWLERKQELEDHIWISMGAYPLPERCPLNTHIYGRVEQDDYTVEKAFFESYPGFFVTGNLYRPKEKTGPFPGIVSPHGHWGTGRLANEETGSVPGRAISLARQGYVVFSYDMIGYVDSRQLDHKFGKEPEWLWGISLHGLQFWNSVRAVDFLQSLEDVDPDRIGCTGASGGGTQTFFLTAVDRRVKVSAPVNMLSAHFQGGCLCENAPNLRINAFNLEFGAMMAPRPLLMVSATGDWTDETPWVEYPAIRSIYKLFDAEDRVSVIQVDAPHNYNQPSREAVYAWFGKWFLNQDDPNLLKEQPFQIENENALRIQPQDLPDTAVSEEELVRNLHQQSEAQLKSYYPSDMQSLRRLRRMYHKALEHVLGDNEPAADQLIVNRIDRTKLPSMFIEKVILGRKGVGDQIPGLLYLPREDGSFRRGVILVHEEGKAAWFDRETGEPGELLRSLLSEQVVVFMPDVFLTGEYNTPFHRAGRDRQTDHFLTYNQTDAALRVQDILTSIAFLDSLAGVNKIDLVGAGEAGLWSILAASLAGNLNAVVADADQFSSGSDAEYLERLFVPGLRRAGDFRTAQSLIAPTPLFIHNTAQVFHTAWGKDAYKACDAANLIEVTETPAGADQILAWLKEVN